MKPIQWQQILKILIALLTAILGAIGVASCV
ncbi:MAG: smalltalk protein [Bacteroidaceae bacterium]|nr:smalltalk protein [Bacteroidaceae bacterium]